MEKMKAAFEKIPWASRGARTPVARLADSLLPLGHFDRPLSKEVRYVKLGDNEFETALMEIDGTGIQVGRGKFLTCWHVCEVLDQHKGRMYIQTTTKREGVWIKTYRPISAIMRFFDPRTEKTNEAVDAGLIISPIKDAPESPFDDYVATWGDSTKLGVGHRVLIGGYPLGKQMFLAMNTNRGIVQPTFYDGVISAIIPATKMGECRILQISTVAMGGISGGAVCDSQTGKVLGMVTSGLEHAGHALPVTYAIPAEVLQPWCDGISFDAADGKRWR